MLVSAMKNEEIKSTNSSKMLGRSSLGMSGLIISLSTTTTATETVGKAQITAAGYSKTRDKAKMKTVTTTNAIRTNTATVKKSGRQIQGLEIAAQITEYSRSKINSTSTLQKRM
jgi:hypothetical protein